MKILDSRLMSVSHPKIGPILSFSSFNNFYLFTFHLNGIPDECTWGTDQERRTYDSDADVRELLEPSMFSGAFCPSKSYRK